MARFRKKSRSRRFGFGKKRYSRRHSSGSLGSGLMPLAAAAIYGAGRSYIANTAAVQKLNSMLPLGTLSDNVVMLGINWAAKKYVPVGIVKQAASAGMIIEAAMIGGEIAQGGLSSTTGGQSSSFVYG